MAKGRAHSETLPLVCEDRASAEEDPVSTATSKSWRLELAPVAGSHKGVRTKGQAEHRALFLCVLYRQSLQLPDHLF